MSGGHPFSTDRSGDVEVRSTEQSVWRLASFDLNIIIIVYFENGKCQMYHLQVTNVTFAILKALFVDFPKLICYDDCKYEKSGGICL